MSETLRRSGCNQTPCQKVADKAKAVRNRANAMRDYLRFNMAQCGITEIKSNDGLLTIKAAS